MNFIPYSAECQEDYQINTNPSALNLEPVHEANTQANDLRSVAAQLYRKVEKLTNWPHSTFEDFESWLSNVDHPVFYSAVALYNALVNRTKLLSTVLKNDWTHQNLQIIKHPRSGGTFQIFAGTTSEPKSEQFVDEIASNSVDFGTKMCVNPGCACGGRFSFVKESNTFEALAIKTHVQENAATYICNMCGWPYGTHKSLRRHLGNCEPRTLKKMCPKSADNVNNVPLTVRFACYEEMFAHRLAQICSYIGSELKNFAGGQYCPELVENATPVYFLDLIRAFVYWDLGYKKAVSWKVIQTASDQIQPVGNEYVCDFDRCLHCTGEKKYASKFCGHVVDHIILNNFRLGCRSCANLFSSQNALSSHYSQGCYTDAYLNHRHERRQIMREKYKNCLSK